MDKTENPTKHEYITELFHDQHKIVGLKLGDNTFVFEWFAGINCIILWSQI